MEYKIKLDYSCQEVQRGGQWFTIESEKEPTPKDIGLRHPLALLPPHPCKIGMYSTRCEGDINCIMQKILEVKVLSNAEY